MNWCPCVSFSCACGVHKIACSLNIDSEKTPKNLWTNISCLNWGEEMSKIKTVKSSSDWNRKICFRNTLLLPLNLVSACLSEWCKFPWADFQFVRSSFILQVQLSSPRVRLAFWEDNARCKHEIFHRMLGRMEFLSVDSTMSKVETESPPIP